MCCCPKLSSKQRASVRMFRVGRLLGSPPDPPREPIHKKGCGRCGRRFFSVWPLWPYLWPLCGRCGRNPLTRARGSFGTLSLLPSVVVVWPCGRCPLPAHLARPPTARRPTALASRKGRRYIGSIRLPARPPARPSARPSARPWRRGVWGVQPPFRPPV